MHDYNIMITICLITADFIIITKFMVYGKYIHDYVPNAVIILMIIDS